MRDGWVRTLKKIGKKIGFAAVLAGAMSAGAAWAQTAEQAWLKYMGGHANAGIPQNVRALGSGVLEQSAVEELKRGLAGMEGARTASGETVIGTLDEVRRAYPLLKAPAHLEAHGFWLRRTLWRGHPLVVVAGSNEHGALFGAFDLLRRIATGQNVSHLDALEAPAMPIRWVDEWDNANGTIERGYGGRSIFFDAGHVRDDLAPVHEYARLLASIGINGCNLNNVNNAAPFLEPEMLKGIARIADTMRPYGVRVALSVDVASPEKIGGLKTYDPLDPAVIAWWNEKADEIYKLIPDFAGFTVKADSEGQPGPASYGRSPADAANTLAKALEPHGGVVLYRAFVYNHHLDWKDPKADRARAAYDIFHPLDGKFAPNVIVQVKEGPIDFQAQEPVSPLFGGLEKTNQAMELQITQEYLGQQRHLVYIAPMWKWVLDFDLRAENRSTPVKEIIEGRTFDRPLGGMIGVACVGQELARLTAGDGEPVRVRAAGVGSGPDGATDRQGMGAADARGQCQRGAHRDQNADAVVAGVRGLHRAAGHADADRYYGQPLRAEYRGQREQRLGPVAQGGPLRRWDGPHGCHGNRLRGAILDGSSEDLRECANHAGQFADLLPSRSVHVEAGPA